MPIDLHRMVHPSWVPALEPLTPTLQQLSDMAAQETDFLPEPTRVLRALRLPLEAVRVLIVGQDPYPTPGHAVGLSFSVERDVRPIPRSLVNIYAELHSDLGIPPAEHGDLSGWFDQGVLLLNRILTVAPGSPGSHRGRGWEDVTLAAIEALAGRGGPLVAILWGRQARNLAPTLKQHRVPCIESVHPSPLSARHGFFGSRPFSRTNELLTQQGGTPIDWRIS